MNARSAILLFTLALLYGCGNQGGNSGPGGVSAEDAKALDAAAEKLDREAAGETQEN